MLKGKYLATMLAAPAIALGAMAVFSEPGLANSANITCKNDGTPTIVASKGDGSADLTILKFVDKYFPSSEDALQNCQTTAQKLQNLYNNDSLYTLTSDTVDGQPLVCAVEGIDPCDSDGAEVLFTLNQDDDPSTALYDMLGSSFRRGEKPDLRTVSRIYTDIRPRIWPKVRVWW